MTMKVELRGGPWDGQIQDWPDDNDLMVMHGLAISSPAQLQAMVEMAPDDRVPLTQYAYARRTDHPEFFDYLGERAI